MAEYFKTSVAVGAVATNPAINTVLVTTGAISEPSSPGGLFVQPQVIVSCSVAANFKLQVWDGIAEVAAMFIAVAANSTVSLFLCVPLQLADNRHLRVLNTAAITGTCQANILLGYSRTA